MRSIMDFDHRLLQQGLQATLSLITICIEQFCLTKQIRIWAEYEVISSLKVRQSQDLQPMTAGVLPNWGANGGAAMQNLTTLSILGNSIAGPIPDWGPEGWGPNLMSLSC